MHSTIRTADKAATVERTLTIQKQSVVFSRLRLQGPL